MFIEKVIETKENAHHLLPSPKPWCGPFKGGSVLVRERPWVCEGCQELGWCFLLEDASCTCPWPWFIPLQRQLIVHSDPVRLASSSPSPCCSGRWSWGHTHHPSQQISSDPSLITWSTARPLIYAFLGTGRNRKEWAIEWDIKKWTKILLVML